MWLLSQLSVGDFSNISEYESREDIGHLDTWVLYTENGMFFDELFLEATKKELDC